MTNQPKRIWIDAKHGQHPDDWSFYVEGDITAKDHRKAGRLPYVPEVSSTIEAPSQEPADSRPSNCRFRLADEGKPYPRSSCQACGKNILTGLGNSCKNVTTQPDHLALVAAAYRDAADACDDYPRAAPEEAEWTRYDEQIAHSKDCILASTPADAQAALAAIERAAYERGVMEAAATINRGGLHTSADYSDCILALLKNGVTDL